ncbi:MAG: methyltransferase domain-containing protein [Pseudonocardia sp.]|uniref:class I SAM-dependent methyltransferase n=1 Tax=unclassified Pseudonocardia TaxID=2619320 RepID=UPI00086ABD62|nr:MULTISPECIES: class I SAM-dependent methyltransferase [unclassified Pseudonocardia]MBN9112092.1 methyltransferase domain-containing protein [Pseudonocardia sp.]ODU22939.1 MAG: hypothetical protein ABS80_16445 [Pseudonocardia sp. SCN 72-51]ODV05991.1 MAG: hypothetical protein ABT15_14325 [Pseudonocardia sp. SCN 73-27]
MSGPEGVARTYGRRWSTGSGARAEHYALMSAPAWEVVADATGIGDGIAVLDVCCGSGEFLTLVRERGAHVAGIDAAEGMVALARRVDSADVRLGSLEALPWPDATFDVVTGFNGFQFAPDMGDALAEAARVVREGGQVAVCNWGGDGPQELMAVTEAARSLGEDTTLVPRLPIGEPGVVEAMLTAAGLTPTAAGDVAVPWAPPDDATLLRGLMSAGSLVPTIEQIGADAVRAAILDAAAPHRAADGSYLFASTFRWVVGRY